MDRSLSIVGVVAAFLALSAPAPEAEESMLQFEGRAAYVFAQPLPYIAPSAVSGALFNSNLYAARNVTDSLSLIFEDRLYGGNRQPLFPEQVHPLDNHLFLSLCLQKFGTWQVGASNDVFPFDKALPTPYYLSNQTMTPEMLNMVDGSWNLETERLFLRGAVAYGIYNFQLRPRDPFAGPSASSSEPFGPQRDADVWTDASAGLTVTRDITLNAGAFIKNDLNAYSGYDINEYWAGFSGENRFSRNRMVLAWDARENLLYSQVMNSEGLSVGPSTEAAMRFIWKKASDLYIKAVARVELAQRLHKQLYEVMLRKTWQGGSSLDICYYGTGGVLFPRSSGRVAATFQLLPHLAVSPSFEAYVGRIAAESAFRFYRGDGALEFLLPITGRFEAFVGAGCSLYDRHPLFASRTSLYSGIRTW